MKRAPGRIAAMVVAAALALTGAPAATAAASDPAARAVSYLLQRQSEAGTIGRISAADAVAEAVATLSAAGVRGRPIERSLALIEEAGPARARETAGRAGRIVLGLVAAGRDPRAFGGTDYVAIIDEHYNAAVGEYDETNLYSNALAALAWMAAGEDLPARARTFLLANECRGGGFGWRAACAGGPDADTTAMILTTLIRTGGAEEAVARARGWLLDARNADGGFGQPGQPTNANSTGLALSAIAAFGDDPRRPPWRAGDADPMRALVRLEAAGGGFRYLASQDEADDYATVQALPGLIGASYPLRQGDRSRAPARSERRVDAPGRPPAATTPSPSTRTEPLTGDPTRGSGDAGGAVVLGARRTRAAGDQKPLAPVVLAAGLLAGVAVAVGRTAWRRQP